jgi:hypothetical protein
MFRGPGGAWVQIQVGHYFNVNLSESRPGQYLPTDHVTDYRSQNNCARCLPNLHGKKLFAELFFFLKMAHVKVY